MTDFEVGATRNLPPYQVQWREESLPPVLRTQGILIVSQRGTAQDRFHPHQSPHRTRSTNRMPASWRDIIGNSR